MTLAAQTFSLLRQSASPDVRPDKSSERVWHLTYPGLFASDSSRRREHVDALKVRLLEIVVRTGSAMIHHPDSPREEKLPGEWREGPQPQTWHVPADLDLADDSIASWLLTLGNWVMLAPDVETTRLPDFARAPIPTVLSWVDEQAIELVIDSFHDDISWVVVLASAHPAA